MKAWSNEDYKKRRTRRRIYHEMPTTSLGRRKPVLYLRQLHRREIPDTVSITPQDCPSSSLFLLSLRRNA
ncbi:hypothetical protein M378DRAFT_168652 [Amanita muscaria Koide BX008]|uniref:Uncharacterized protein n=1 Tax=Amanita muscaria (strain Koide BX008) TaxID=946122 RepID=A0A0C2SB45_AMAMK|nr:hypothetical protein M378DRAFT_168652 [Amanita muscaria Koide BX008]